MALQCARFFLAHRRASPLTREREHFRNRKLSLLRKERFDYASLGRTTDGLQRTEMPTAAPSTAVAPETSS
jgi:hypothetical protein